MVLETDRLILRRWKETESLYEYDSTLDDR